jgi:hypothetical protein
MAWFSAAVSPVAVSAKTGSTVKVTVTGAAAAYAELPGRVAVMEQVPAATSVTVVPETVQTPV